VIQLIKIFISISILMMLTSCAHNETNKTDQKPDEAAPKLKRPEVRRVWVPDQITGDEYVTGHWKYLIEKNSVWTKEN